MQFMLSYSCYTYTYIYMRVYRLPIRQGINKYLLNTHAHINVTSVILYRLTSDIAVLYSLELLIASYTTRGTTSCVVGETGSSCSRGGRGSSGSSSGSSNSGKGSRGGISGTSNNNRLETVQWTCLQWLTIDNIQQYLTLRVRRTLYAHPHRTIPLHSLTVSVAIGTTSVRKSTYVCELCRM